MGPAQHLMRDIMPKKELSYGIQWYVFFPGSDCTECDLRNKWVSVVGVCLHPDRITALLFQTILSVTPKYMSTFRFLTVLLLP